MMTITGKRMRLLTAASVAAAVALLAGCGGGGDDGGTSPNPVTKSSFSATLSGAVSGTYSGESAFGTDGQGNFALGLGAGTGQSQGLTIVFARQGGGVPSAQKYDLADFTAGGAPANGQFWVLVTVASSGSAVSLAGKSGSITITSAGGGRLKGTFQFTAVNLSNAQSTATVSGTFDAVTGNVAIP